MDKHHPTASMDTPTDHHVPSSETERLAFESWMRGHSWLVGGVWNGTTYDDRGPSRVSSVDVGAMQTRMLWAAWRDRAALACLGRPAIDPVPVSERFEFSVFNSEYEEQAGGTVPTYAEALSYGQHYLAVYSQDGLHSLELRRVEVLPHHALPVPEVTP